MDLFEKPYELENQFILRLPQRQADKLKEIILAGNLKDRLSIDIQADQRQGAVLIDGETLKAKLYDLPCIIESLKTLEMKTFYKTADISQILVCSSEDKTDSSDQPISKTNHLKEKKFLWPHGVTPPLKNIRHRRFRKTARKKYGESPDVQKEVMRLLKADTESCVPIKYEVVYEEDKDSSKISNQTGEMYSNSVPEELNKIFGDISSSESESESQDGTIQSRWHEYTSKELPTGIDVATDPDQIEVLEAKVEQLSSELTELEKRRHRKENLIFADNIQNELLKKRFQHEFDELTQRYKESRQEYLTCLVMLGRAK